MQLQQGIGHAAEYLSAGEKHVAVADGGDVEIVLDGQLKAIVLVIAVQHVFQSRGEIYAEDGIVGPHRHLVERLADDNLVFRQAGAHVEFRGAYAGKADAVRVKEVHVAGGEHFPVAVRECVRNPLPPLLLVFQVELVDERHFLVVAPGEDGRQDVAGGEGVLAGSQLQQVVLAAYRQFRSRLVIEHVFHRSPSFHFSVLRAIGRDSGEAHPLAEVAGGLHPQLETHALEVVKAQQFVIGTESHVFRVVIP